MGSLIKINYETEFEGLTITHGHYSDAGNYLGVCFALGHATIQQTQGYLKQFPNNYADKAIKVFEDIFEL